MHTAQKTAAGESLRVMLPDGSDPYATIELACHTAFLARDRVMMPELTTVAAADPQLAAGLIVTLAALVDIDARPDTLLDWLGTHEGREQETIRTLAALTEARQEYDEAAADRLPEVTLESIRDLIHAARLAGVAQPCGTPAGFARHGKRKQTPCWRCRTARRLYENATPEERALIKKPLPNTNLKAPVCEHPIVECGTLAGYDFHIRDEEPPCAACRQVFAAMLAEVMPLPRHGTGAGFDAHAERGEKPCIDCRRAVQLVDDLAPPKKRASCGSSSGYAAHKRQRERPCERCSKARSRQDAARRKRKQRQDKLPPTWRPSCGSRAGYNAHCRAGEERCDACAQAQQVYSAEQYARRTGQPIPHAEPSPPVVAPSWPDGLIRDLMQEVANLEVAGAL